MNLSDVVYEVGRHYVVRLREDRRGCRREAYEVRVQEHVSDRAVLRVSGFNALPHALEQARAMHLQETLVT